MKLRTSDKTHQSSSSPYYPLQEVVGQISFGGFSATTGGSIQHFQSRSDLKGFEGCWGLQKARCGQVRLLLSGRLSRQ